MPDQHLHIVCLDVPYPPDYGGVFDLFYKIKALRAKGVLIHLHCFEYGRGKQPELNKYCISVNYYTRKSFITRLIYRVPFIVSSRASEELIQNLSRDNYPVLLEGIHCTWLLYSGKLRNRKVAVRLHNVEFEYYRELAHTTGNFLKKIYYKRESALLKKYERTIANRCLFIAVSMRDRNTYREMFHAKNIQYLPVFLPFDDVSARAGSGSFCLYHGNLSIAENEKAAVWLIKNIFASLQIPLIIAGKNPSEKLYAAASRYSNVSVAANPSRQQMDEFITNAHIHVLPSFNTTGIKIKLLNALFNGRYVITNSAAIEGTHLENICTVANTPEEYVTHIRALMRQPFDITEKDKRKELLNTIFNSEKNAAQLMQWLW
ncbi:MAG TPA: glycosyltransferase [Chitinophagaceae bacterium]|nr:glycosyltransferase [Chitinophagaceae bacterium]